MNQHVTKKQDYKRIDSVIPYLGKPDWLEHEKVKNALTLISSCSGRKAALDDRLKLIWDEIVSETSKEESERDEYLITRLYQIYTSNKKESD